MFIEKTWDELSYLEKYHVGDLLDHSNFKYTFNLRNIVIGNEDEDFETNISYYICGAMLEVSPVQAASDSLIYSTRSFETIDISTQ